MNRYERDYYTPAARRGYDEDVQGRPAGGRSRGSGLRAERGRGAPSYGGDYRGGERRRGGPGYGSDYRAFERGPQPGRQPGWGMEPGSELTGGYSDYSPRGRFGGYFGAWDTRPLGRRADIEQGSRRRGNR